MLPTDPSDRLIKGSMDQAVIVSFEMPFSSKAFPKASSSMSTLNQLIFSASPSNGEALA